MSNQVTILVSKLEVLTKDPTVMYGIIAYDGYGTAQDIGYDSLEQLYEAYPTRESLIDWLYTQEAFDGSQYIDVMEDEFGDATSVRIQGHYGSNY